MSEDVMPEDVMPVVSGRGRFGRQVSSDGGLLLYRLEGEAGDVSPLPGALFRAVERDVAEREPRHVAFDMTRVTDFRGCPAGFLARACDPVRERGGTVFVILGPGHSPSVRRVLTVCRVIAGPGSRGFVNCHDSLAAVERAVAAGEPSAHLELLRKP